MPAVLNPPHSAIDPVTDVLHGVPVTDPYRWLEDQNSPRTRAWIDEQTHYARGYLDSIPGRERIRERVRDLLAVETYDSLQKVGTRYFFRKRLPNQEQPCIYIREGADGEDQVLINPAERGTGPFTAVKMLRISLDGNLLLYEIKQGGERTGRFEILDISTGQTLADALPHGYLRGFAFAPDARSFYYVHEAIDTKRPFYRSVFRHVLGRDFADDSEIFFAGESKLLSLSLISDSRRLGFLVCRLLDKPSTDFHLQPFGSNEAADCILRDADYFFRPRLLDDGRILGITDRGAPNLRIVQVQKQENGEYCFCDLVPETDARIRDWLVAGGRLYVGYVRRTETRVDIFDIKEHGAEKIGQLPFNRFESVRLMGTSSGGDEFFLETESFTEPTTIFRSFPRSGQRELWMRSKIPLEACAVSQKQVWYTAEDGTSIAMFLLAQKNVLDGGIHPAIMTSYGGYGISMTPQFSVLVSFLVEHGCLFALPNIRGGSEFGAAWHQAAQRRKRQVAFGDFLSAAKFMISSGRTTSDKLAIFGGSNSGLLVGAALTQRPHLFRAVVCLVPMLDMLRYHLFDNADVSKDEFGTADDPEDFLSLLGYSPYHNVRRGTAYPATMLVSGDADQNCNGLHARKMTARLQAANVSEFPIFLDYSPLRGHSPVLPLSTRVEALTDRLAFLCDQLGPIT